MPYPWENNSRWRAPLPQDYYIPGLANQWGRRPYQDYYPVGYIGTEQEAYMPPDMDAYRPQNRWPWELPTVEASRRRPYAGEELRARAVPPRQWEYGRDVSPGVAFPGAPVRPWQYTAYSTQDQYGRVSPVAWYENPYWTQTTEQGPAWYPYAERWR